MVASNSRIKSFRIRVLPDQWSAERRRILHHQLSKSGSSPFAALLFERSIDDDTDYHTCPRAQAWTVPRSAKSSDIAMGNTAVGKVKEEERMGNVSVDELGDVDTSSVTGGMDKLSLSNPPHLPYDLFGEIARSLVADGSYKTAAHLNQTCRAAHEETLPILYETMIVYDAEAFASSLGKTDSKGFKHVKYLIATPQTLKVLAEHIMNTRTLTPCPCEHGPTNVQFRHAVPGFISILANYVRRRPAPFVNRCSTDRTGVEGAFCAAFPRLVFFSKCTPTITEGCLVATAPVTVDVTVYRPVSLDVILDRLAADKSTNWISFFGVKFSRHVVKETAKGNRAQYIESIGLQEGSYVIPGLHGRDVDVSRDGIAVVDLGSTQTYDIGVQGDHPDPRVRGVFELMMDCATYGMESGRERNRRCDLTLWKEALAILTEAIAARPSSTVPPMKIQILPCQSVQPRHLHEFLASLVSAYAQGWTHNAHKHGETFLKIEAGIPMAAATVVNVPDPVDVPNPVGKLRGIFKYGAGDGTTEADFRGFNVTFSRGYEYVQQGTTIEHYDSLPKEHYPCAEVPFVMPHDVQLRQPPQVQTHVFHLTAHIPLEMARHGFTLGPVEMMRGDPDGEEDDNHGAGQEGAVRITNVQFLGFVPR